MPYRIIRTHVHLDNTLGAQHRRKSQQTQVHVLQDTINNGCLANRNGHLPKRLHMYMCIVSD